jgi:hypothetical protein
MTSTHRYFLAIALTALAPSIASSISPPIARAWTEVPPFPPDGRVAVRGVETDFQPLRDSLRRFESAVGAKYHVLVVEYSDPENRDGPDYGDESGQYIDRVVEAWTPSADPQNSVLVVLAIRNRDIIVHPFSRWARLGWEADEVKRTIDDSSFGARARAGDYNTAIAELVRAIDRELERRVADEQAVGVRAQQRIAGLATLFGAYDRETENVAFDLTSARVARDRGAEKTREAEEALAADDPQRALLLADQAERSLTTALALVSEARVADRDARERLPVVRELAARIRRHPRFGDSTYAQNSVAEGERTLATAEEALADGRSLEARQLMDAAERSLRGAEDELHRVETHRRFTHQILPIVLAVLFAVLLSIVLFIRLAVSRSRRKHARSIIAEWDAMLGRAGEKLLALENEHPLLLSDPTFATRFVGASAEPVRDAARHVDDLFLAYDVAVRLVRDAKTRLARSWFGFLRTGPADRVVKQLTVEELVARTEDVKEKRLFLPDKREVRRKPQELLADMEKLYAEAKQRLASVEARFQAIWASLDAIRADIETAEAAQDAIAIRGHARALASSIDETDRAWDELNGRARTDPLGCLEEGPALAAKATDVRDRAQRIQTAVELADEARANVAEASRKVAELRAQSLAVSEPGFEPDVMAEHAERSLNLALASALVAEDAEALARATEAADTAKELLELVGATDRARSESPERIERESARLATLRERLEERRARLTALRADHHDDALAPALDNADEAKGVLLHAESCLATAKRSITSATQHFLAGRELIDRAAGDLDDVEALYEEIEHKAAALADAKARTEQRIADARTTCEEIDALIGESDVFASEATLEARASSRGEIERLEGMLGGPRPNWLRLLAESGGASQIAGAALTRARAEHEAWQTALRLRDSLASERQRLAAELGASSEDRALANERFGTASGWLDEAIARSEDERPDWIAVIARLRDAEAGLRDARELARADYEAAKSARFAMAELDAAIRAADVSYGHGVHAALDPARAALAGVAGLLAANDFEGAIRTATAARDAVRAIEREARIRAQDRARDRARRQSALASQSSRSAFGSSRSSFGSSSFGSSKSSSRSSIGSSSRSSSFGSSSRSSSRSSFGSSSGRSSFGRSSGRSKW